jgi:hypothetical protein
MCGAPIIFMQTISKSVSIVQVNKQKRKEEHSGREAKQIVNVKVNRADFRCRTVRQDNKARFMANDSEKEKIGNWISPNKIMNNSEKSTLDDESCRRQLHRGVWELTLDFDSISAY